MTSTAWLQRNTFATRAPSATKAPTVADVPMASMAILSPLETTASRVDAVPMEIRGLRDTVTISRVSALLVWETQEAGTVTLVCLVSMEIQATDSADHASATSMGPSQMSAMHELDNVTARKNMSGERVVSAEMDLELSALVVGSATVILWEPKVISAMQTLANADASQVSLGSPATSAYLFTLDSLLRGARAVIAIPKAQFLSNVKARQESVHAGQESRVVVVTSVPLAHGVLLQARAARLVSATRWGLKTMTAMM